MKAHRQSGSICREAGSALLIGIFALLLISVVGIALLISTGTDSSLAGNYRTSTAAYYAVLAGLEEGRGRVLFRNPDFINKSNAYPTLFNAQGTSFGLMDVLYILNPNTAIGETVDPTNSTSPYADTEYGTEFGWQPSAANVYTALSVSPVPASSPPLPGPLYKWVRINAITEKAINMAVDCNAFLDSTTPLFYGGSGLYRPGSGCPSNPTTGAQALEITAFAYMPDKSTKLLQYLVAPLNYGVNNPPSAALNLLGSGIASPGITFPVPTISPSFQINGSDGSGPLSSAPACTPTASTIWAIGVTDIGSNQANYDLIRTAIDSSGQEANYKGAATTQPPPHSHSHTVPVSLQDDISLNPVMLTPANLNSMVQTISQNADLVLNKNATDSDMPSAMSSANPMTVVVNGNLTLSNFTGYGLLVVTGNFVSNPNAGWRGIVLVVGAGNATFTGGSGGNGEYDGGIFVAQTLDTSVSPPNPLTTMGTATFDASNAGGSGIFYNSCWINSALKPPTFQVLSFREIAQ